MSYTKDFLTISSEFDGLMKGFLHDKKILVTVIDGLLQTVNE